jgi:signal transduction histidine kinase
MSIQGYALAVQDEVEAQEQAIGVIRKESQRLIEMVNRLLELARLESTEEVWPLSLVDLREMAEQATEIMAPLAADRNVRLSVRSDGPVETEIPGEQMFQVMLNLLHNAVRHAASKARITVRGQAAGGWSVDVEDDGEGVPEALREKVFDRFYKGVKGGTGLGLTICRQIAERMGATIVCRRSEWGGAWFRFECPSSRKTPARSADD